jgi:hypothetical protein
MRKDDGLFEGAGGNGREIDRRTIAKGVAWTVPVVIVATAAPAAAASGDVTFLNANYFPQLGNSTAKLTTQVKVDGGRGITIVFSLVQGATSYALANNTFTVSGIQTITLDTVAAAGLAPIPSTLNYTITAGQGSPGAVPVDVSAVSTLANPGVSVSPNGGEGRTFTFHFAKSNAASSLVITAVTTQGIKQNGTPGTPMAWTVTNASRADLGTGVVAFNLTRPTPGGQNKTGDWARTTVDLTLDNQSLSVVVDAS